ncbi:hypothetical protein CI15_33420 [Paraburkholderia monticola]|uniref:DUF7693 domain-containing protein n=1 Tax=Paraburkholderia monticola TaxID=1399968 RepID=A0A149PBP3_9BURK|nr:hypothetical protein [Paraburkholderia monticola]KXU82436.1 hypothetical protein CI15_33420 [Paraburkholderia monticola]
MSAIQASEIVEVFRQALRGEIAVKVEGDESWDKIYCGDVEFMFGEWRIVVFNDCSEFDYVSSALAPDGREGEFDDWWPGSPVDMLTMEELAAMENLVESLEPEVRA